MNWRHVAGMFVAFGSFAVAFILVGYASVLAHGHVPVDDRVFAVASVLLLVVVTTALFLSIAVPFKLIDLRLRSVRHRNFERPPRTPDEDAAESEYLSIKAEYATTRDLTWTCDHLRTIESAMRAENITVRFGGSPFARLVRAECSINEERLGAQFPLPAEVTYVERYEADDRGHEQPFAGVICSKHRSWIETTHSDVWRPPEPVFPA